MSTSVKDIHTKVLGDTSYRFRSPAVHDSAKLRRTLTLQRVRRPDRIEFLVASRVGIKAMAEKAGEIEEGDRQLALVEEFHELSVPVKEDDLDEIDPVRRAALLKEKEEERKARLQEIYPEVHAIEANLERHHPPYAELKADVEYWDAISRIEVVRLLLVEIDGEPVVPDEDGIMAESAYLAIDRNHRVSLATMAFGLLSISEKQRKN